LSKRRAIALVASSMLVLGGCEPAEQQIGDLHVLKVPSTFLRSKPFPALGKTLAATKPGQSVEIALDFPLHPAGWSYPQPIDSTGVRIRRGSVRFSSGEAYITLLSDKRVLYKPNKDAREVALHYDPQSDYEIGLGTGGLAAWGSGCLILNEKGEDANGNRGISFPTDENGEWSRVYFRVECSKDFDGELGDYFVWQPE
jgi:hypothetical protein